MSTKDNQPPQIGNFIYHLYFDGCSKGNPGKAGAGAVIYNNDGEEIWHTSVYVGDYISNNYAEYAGLIIGLEKADELNIKNLIVRGDSELIICQMNGKYKCSSRNLISLYSKAKELERKIENVNYAHILRHLNRRADELANQAMEK